MDRVDAGTLKAGDSWFSIRPPMPYETIRAGYKSLVTIIGATDKFITYTIGKDKPIRISRNRAAHKLPLRATDEDLKSFDNAVEYDLLVRKLTNFKWDAQPLEMLRAMWNDVISTPLDDRRLAEELVYRLNLLIKNEEIRKDVFTLLETRIPVCPQTCKHPTIQVSDGKLGLLGFLNGLVGTMTPLGYGHIAAVFSDDGLILERFELMQVPNG